MSSYWKSGELLGCPMSIKRMVEHDFQPVCLFCLNLGPMPGKIRPKNLTNNTESKKMSNNLILKMIAHSKNLLWPNGMHSTYAYFQLGHFAQTSLTKLINPKFVYGKVDRNLVFGAVHKRHPKSGGRGLSSTDILQTRGEGGSSDADVRACREKLRVFYNFMVCPHE